MNRIVVAGLNFKTAPIRIRELLSFDINSIQEVLKELHELPFVHEIMLISTCNRTEIISFMEAPEENWIKVMEKLTQRKGIEIQDIKPHLFMINGINAVVHVLKLASSLESMVIGEPQITAQFKEAFNEAAKARTVGKVLNYLYQLALKTSKKVRSETEISSRAVSVSYAAVELAAKIFETFHDKNVVLVGAGQMAELAAIHFREKGVKRIDVVNKTFSKALELAEKYQGKAYPIERLKEALKDADIILSSTSSKTPVLKKELIEEIMRQRKARPMLILDIAVPRDVEQEVEQILGVFLYNIDDLKKIVEINLKIREKEAIKAEKIILKMEKEFVKWWNVQDATPLIVSLRRKFYKIADEETKKTLKKHKFDPEFSLALKQTVFSIINKLLHDPLSTIKEKANTEDKEEFFRTVKSIFKLEDN